MGPNGSVLKNHKNRANGGNEGVKAGRNLFLGGGFSDYVVYIYMPARCLQLLFGNCRISGVKTRSLVLMCDVVVAASVVRGFSQFCVIAMKSGNAGFDISVAIYSVHLAVELDLFCNSLSNDQSLFLHHNGFVM